MAAVLRCAPALRRMRPLALASRVRSGMPLSGGAFATQKALCRNVRTQVPVSALEMYQAGELARKPPQGIAPADIRDALRLFTSMPKLMLPAEEVSAIAQQLLRVLLSYQQWYLPRVMRLDVPGVPEIWSVGVPSPDAAPGGAQLLPLASDEAAFQSASGRGVRDGSDATVMKIAISGVDAMLEHLHGQGRWEGLVLNPGTDTEVVIDKDQLSQLHMWEATLRLEALMSRELVESPGEQPPASDELAELLAGQVKLCFVQMGDDLARDDGGNHIITLTSNDAAAMCANAYGREMVRPVTPQQLLTMAEGAAGAFEGYALTLGSDMAPYSKADGKHIPRWHTRKVPAEWMATALRKKLSASA